MKVIDIHAHAIFKETLNSIKGLGPEIGGDQDNPWFRVGDYRLEGVRYENTPFMDINLRLEAMDSLGIDYQVISPNPITFELKIKGRFFSSSTVALDILATRIQLNRDRATVIPNIPLPKIKTKIDIRRRSGIE